MVDLMIDFATGRPLPIDVVTQATAIAGRRGTGKSYGAMKMGEGLMGAGAQVVVLDPVGSWFGLRIAADGVSPGIPVPVLGGLHGDGPLDKTAGEAVARAVVETRSSVIIDLSMMRKGDRERFATAFATELYHCKKLDRTPMCLVLEEAHTFAPQQAQGGAERPMLGAMEDIVRLGRNFGVGAIMITQRPQAVHKSVWSQAELVVVHQLTGPRERAAIIEWVTDHDAPVKEQLADLPSLQTGEAFLWSPQWLGVFERVQVGRRWTFDTSATPRFGDEQIVPEPLPIDTPALPVLVAAAAGDPAAEGDDVDKPRARGRGRSARASSSQPAAAPEQARMRALRADLDSAQRQVASLKAELAARPERIVERPVLDEEDRERLAGIVASQEQIARDVTVIRRRAEMALTIAPKPYPQLAIEQPADEVEIAEPGDVVPLANAAKQVAHAPDSSEDDALTRYESGVLQAVMQVPGASYQRIALLAARSPRSSAFEKAMRALRTRGLVEKIDDNAYRATRIASTIMRVEMPPTDLDALLDDWVETLSARTGGRIHAVLLDVIRQRHPLRMRANDLEHASKALHPPGYSARSSAMEKSIRYLRGLGFVEGSLKDGVRLASHTGATPTAVG